MQRLTASNLVSFINQLPTNRVYNYVNPKNSNEILIIRVELPEGPIIVKVRNSKVNQSFETTPEKSISSQMLWRLANALQENQPINVERVFGSSYNTRSVLEALLAHTPQFYYCKPGRIESINFKTTVRPGHKHLVWLPNTPHRLGVLTEKQLDNAVVSEIPIHQIFYDSLAIPDEIQNPELDIDIQRRHAQIQFALYLIGRQLNYSIWIAQNDKGIVYKDKKFSEYEGVLSTLNDVQLMQAFGEAIKAALLIDCIWFKNGSLMPAVMEIEHSTGVTSGLTRMKNFQDNFPPFPTRYVVVAADDERSKVISEANKEQFRSLDTRFLPYSSVEELFYLCQRRKLKGITEDFLDCFMEKTLETS